jgi:xylose isomerase-like TIM barrel protein
MPNPNLDSNFGQGESMKLATTAFSFTNEWLARQYSLEQLLARVAALDLGPGVELIGFQTWRSYPTLAAEEVLAFRRLLDDRELEPAALGAYVDLGRRVDRPMTTHEAVDFLRPQIAAAEALGFPLLRLHTSIPVEVLERLTPEAERAGVTLATEVQGAQTPDAPPVAALLECRERVESPNLGLALDFSVAMTRVPASFVQSARRLGIARGELEAVIALWARGASTQELFAALGELGAPAEALDEARGAFFRFGRQDPAAWLPLVPQIAYAHAKFWELDYAGDDPTVRSAELIGVLRDGGYDGFVCTEWGGSAWLDLDDVDAFDLVRRHHELCHTVISKPAAEVPA